MKDLLYKIFNDASLLLLDELRIVRGRDDLDKETRDREILKKEAALTALGALKYGLDN